jgi:hypothetical protein
LKPSSYLYKPSCYLVALAAGFERRLDLLVDNCECQNTTRRQFLAKLGDLQAGSDVRLMVTARFIPDIEDTFRAALKLEVRARREDVKSFIAGQTYRLATCIKRSAALQDMVQENILNAVDGM